METSILSPENTLSQNIAAALAYYAEDPKHRRSVTSGSYGSSNCKYNGLNNDHPTPGCIVGMFLNPEHRSAFDDPAIAENNWIDIINQAEDLKISDDISSPELIEAIDGIPEDLIENADLFSDLQGLHDSIFCWNLEENKGLSRLGKIRLKDTIAKFSTVLKEEDFSEILK